MSTTAERQRQLKRDYLDQPPAAGVFSIRHIASGRLLLGAGANVAGLLNRHRFELVRGQHRNRALQAAWQADGADAFALEVVATVKPRPEVDGFDPVTEAHALLALWNEDTRRRAVPRYDEAGA